MDYSRSTLLPVQAPEFNPDIRGVSPKATMNVQTSSPIGKLEFVFDQKSVIFGFIVKI